MHFTQLNSANADPDLKLYGAGILVVSEFKFLGLIFDKKLTFNKHVKYLKDGFMYCEGAKLITSSHTQGLRSGLCNFA